MTNPYVDICKPIKEWCEKNYYSDFLVTIKVNDREITEFLEFDPSTMHFIWNNDWWEDEENVQLLGFSPIEDIKLHNYLTKDRAFKFEMDGEEAQLQVIRDAKKYGLAILRPYGWWIPAEKRLPEQQGHYLICFHFPGDDAGVCEAVFNARTGKWYDPIEEYFEFTYVTHWTPLPEPPKEGEG